MMRTTATRPELRVGGQRLSAIVPHWDSLEHSSRPNGDWLLTFRIAAPAHWRHPALVKKSLAELMYGAEPLFAGSVSEPNWDTGEIAVFGASREADDALALDSTGNASTKPNEVIDAAIARGALSWTRVGDFGNTALGEPGGALVKLRSILDAWAERNGKVWHVTPRRELIILSPSESSPRWLVTPGSGVLGTAGDQQVDVVAVRYINAATGRRDTARYPGSSPVRPNEQPKDLTKQGAISTSAATATAQSIWNELQGRPGWVNRLELHYGQLRGMGGARADCSSARSPDTFVLRDVADVRGLSQNTSIISDEVSYNWDDDALTVGPRGLAPRDPEAALQHVGDLAVDAMAAAADAARPSEIAGTLSSAPVNGGNIVLPVNSGDVEIAKWLVPAPPAGAVRAYINAVVNARCQFGNQAVGYKLWWSGNGGAVWVELATSYMHNHNDAIQALGTTLGGFVDFPPGLVANQLQFRLLAATGSGAGNTNFGMVNMNATFFTR